MIVLIDGANGVGKSHVAAELEELLLDRNAEYVESDLYWNEAIKKIPQVFRLGFDPYNNKYLIAKLRETVESMHISGKMPIVSMSLVHESCEKGLLDYFEKKGIPILHIILEAKSETIISRIKNDPIRDESAENQQISKVAWQIPYLENNYLDAARIDTEEKTLKEIASEIMSLL